MKQFLADSQQAYEFILGESAKSSAQTSREMEEWKRKNAAVLLQTIAAGSKLEDLDADARAAFDRVHKEFNEIASRTVEKAMEDFRSGKLQKKKQVGISLEKSWHGIHFLLTGQAESGAPPLAWAIHGDTELPDLQKVMGYGPARLLTPKQVGQVHAALAKIEQKNLSRRFDAKAMRAAKVYAVTEQMEFSYFWAYLMVLKAYFAQAAKLKKAMLHYFE